MEYMQNVRYTIFPEETVEYLFMKRLHDLGWSSIIEPRDHALVYEYGVFYSTNIAYTGIGHLARTSRASVTTWLMHGILPHCFTWRGQEDVW